MIIKKLLFGILALFACSDVMALRDDVLIIVNDNSIDSPAVGAYYARQRDIDPANIVHVRVPDSYFISWDEFRRLRDQLIRFMQRNTLDDPALVPAICTDGEPPYYCTAATDQLRTHSTIRYLVTTRGVPTRVVVDGSPLPAPAAPTSVDNYLKYWLINYFGADTRLRFTEREMAFGDGRGMRTVQPASDRELIIGRIDGLTLASAEALLDRTLAAERRGLYGRLFGSTQFNRWMDSSAGRLIYPPAGSVGWPYQLGLFGEARPECMDYLNASGALPEGKTPSYCQVQLNDDNDLTSRASYPAPGNARSRQPQAVDALLYQGWLDGQAAVGSFDAVLNWRRDAQCTLTRCSEAADPAACRKASTDVFRELNSDCVGVAGGFMGYNHQSWPVSYLTVWPTGWYQSTGNSTWSDDGQGDVNQLAFPEVRTDLGFDDSNSLWFRNTDQVADPRCFPGSDFSAPPSLACEDQRRVVLTQRIPLAAARLAIPPTYRIAFRYQTVRFSAPTTLRVRFFVRQADGTQLDYGVADVAALAPGDSGGWQLAEARFPLDPARHSAALYDGIKFRIETSGVYSGALGLDAVSVQQEGVDVELAINGSFSEGHQQVATGDHAATFLDRLGGVAFWGSVSHHQSAGCAFCQSGLEPLVYFLRGLPLGDAVWFDASNNSGILYGDPLYSPVAVRLNPINDTDTLSGVVELSGSTVNGRDPALVSTDYAIDVCAGDDFRLCDRQGAWQSTGISGAGGGENMPLGNWDSERVAPGPYTLRLAVTSLDNVTNRSQTLNDYYPVRVEAVAPPPDSAPPDVSSVQFSIAAIDVAEDAGNVRVTVTRTGDNSGVVSVDYASIGGIAIAGSDYGAVGGTLTFADGVTSQSFSVPILDDTVAETTERFILRLSNVTGGTSLGAMTTSMVAIIDNDLVAPVPAPEPLPVTDPVPVPDEPAPVTDPVPVPEPAPVPEPLPVTDPVPVPEPAPVPEPLPVTDPVPVPEPAPVPQPASAPDPAPVADPVTVPSIPTNSACVTTQDSTNTQQTTWVINLMSSTDRVDIDTLAARADSLNITTVVEEIEINGTRYWRLQVTGFDNLHSARRNARIIQKTLGIGDVWFFSQSLPVNSSDATGSGCSTATTTPIALGDLASVDTQQPVQGTWVINLMSSAELVTVQRLAARAASLDVKTTIAQALVRGVLVWRLQITGFDSQSSANDYAQYVKQVLGITEVWIFEA